ncbi:OmpA family protein [bacterium]|nr:OmpA family protein [bacterium]
MARINYAGLIVIMILALVFPACVKEEAPPIEEVKPAEEEIIPPPPLEEVEEPQLEEVKEEPVVLDDVFFDFDKFDIKDAYRDILTGNAEQILGKEDIIIVIEGYCDERGTDEYNLSLGEKRARAVFDFYVAYGVDAKKLTLISYGEEKPFDSGHNEEAWASNRRAHMVIK